MSADGTIRWADQLLPDQGPPDPVSLDATRPVDLDACTDCIDGTVQVQTGDPYPGAWDGEPCPTCGGTTVRGAA